MKIEVTTDYKVFKQLKGNRLLYKPHLNRLIEAIQESNLLQYNPIEVNSDFELIDGQHRLEAARFLKLPIYYVINPKADIETTTLKNINLREWKSSDHLHKYIELGYGEYIKLQDFAKEYGLSIMYARLIAVDSYIQPHKVRDIFNRGRFAFVNEEKAHNMASFINEVRKFAEDSCWRDREFLRACDIMLKSGIDQKAFIRKLDVSNKPLTSRTNFKDYIRQFEDVLDWNRKDGDRTRLM